METPRIRETDILSVMERELAQQAMRLRINDADAMNGWRSACTQLLREVRCPYQRMSWVWDLAQHLNAGSSVPMEFTVAMLQTDVEGRS